jgi:spectinomycin phosphotransferase
MIEKQLLLDCLKDHYAIRAIALTQLPWGADRDASVYKAQTQDSSYFVKLKRGHSHEISISILELLQKSGIRQVIPPIKTIRGHATHHLGDFTLIVYPFVEGENGFVRNLTDEQWIQLGKTLRQVHEIEVPQSLQNRLRKEAYSPKWREAVRSLYPHFDPQILEKKTIVQRLVDRAEQLAQSLQNQSAPFVLCHSDIHAGNVLIDNKDTLYIVDWDEPIMAPKERDLMFIGGGVANVWNNPREETLFYQGYSKCEVNQNLLAYYRNERIVEDIAIYADPLTADYKLFLEMFKPRGVVDIAFKTSEDI